MRIFRERRIELFIVVEGVDCSGKSTVTSLLARQLNAVLYRTPPKTFLVERSKVDANAKPEDHYKFYLKGLRLASLEIKKLLASNENVVCDRYWLTTCVYHQVMGVSVDLDDFADVIKPSFTVLLLVGSNVQAKRFLDRGMSAGDHRMINRQMELSREYERMLSRQEEPYILINTDNLSPIEIVGKIEVFINGKTV